MNSSTKNEKIQRLTASTMIVGVDIGKDKHFARAFDERGIELGKKALGFEVNEDGFTKFGNWLEQMKAANGKTDMVVGIEPTGHYWYTLYDWAQQYGCEVVQVNPCAVKRTKELDDNSPGRPQGSGNDRRPGEGWPVLDSVRSGRDL